MVPFGLHLAPVAHFPALGTCCTFSRAWHLLHIFPRLAPVAHFPALGTGCAFSHASHLWYIFPRLAHTDKVISLQKQHVKPTLFILFPFAPCSCSSFLFLQTLFSHQSVRHYSAFSFLVSCVALDSRHMLAFLSLWQPGVFRSFSLCILFSVSFFFFRD